MLNHVRINRYNRNSGIMQEAGDWWFVCRRDIFYCITLVLGKIWIHSKVLKRNKGLSQHFLLLILC